MFMRVIPEIEIGREFKSSKLARRFVGPFQILCCVGLVAFHIALPPNLSNHHDVFHVSQLCKYYSDQSYVLETESIHLNDKLELLTFPCTNSRSKDQRTLW